MKFPRRNDDLDWGHDGECMGESLTQEDTATDP